MKVQDLVRILDAKVLTGEDRMDTEVHSACGADMMSDVLAFVKEQAVLLTGLTNPQVVRTAEMMDMRCVVFVRGKQPPEAVVELAREHEMILLQTQRRMFTACGMLYEAGLRGEEGNR